MTFYLSRRRRSKEGYQICIGIANKAKVERSSIDIILRVLRFGLKEAELERRCENEERKRNDPERIPLFDRKRQALGGIDPTEG
jgi:hypothetical protein